MAKTVIFLSAQVKFGNILNQLSFCQDSFFTGSNFRVNSTCGGGADFNERFSIFSEPAYNNHNGTFNSTIIARSPPAGAKFRSKNQLGGEANISNFKLHTTGFTNVKCAK